MQYFIGCSGFYNKDWKKEFYPEKLPQSKWFEYYCTRFNTLELNTTFYRFPTIALLQSWYERSPSNFRFSVKAPRLITHYKQFKETETLLTDFYTALREGLKEKLGPILFQLPAKIMYTEEIFQRILQSFEASYNNVIEFRHASWWNSIVYQKLTERNIGFCGINHPALPDNLIINTSFFYYRFHGTPTLYYSQYPQSTIRKFAEELIQQTDLDTGYIYFNNTATMAAINNATELENLLIK